MAYHLWLTNTLQILGEGENHLRHFLPSTMLANDLLVIVQNSRVRNWVQTQMVMQLGISAGFGQRAMLSRQAVERILAGFAMVNDCFSWEGELEVASKPRILFKSDARLVVFKFLEQQLALPTTSADTYKVVANYVNAGLPSTRITRLFALATSATELLYQYSTYHPEILAQWRAGQAHNHDEQNERWQQGIWWELFGKPHAPFTMIDDVLRTLVEQQAPYSGELRKIVVVGSPFLDAGVQRLLCYMASFLELHHYSYTSVELSEDEPLNEFVEPYIGTLLEQQELLANENIVRHYEWRPKTATTFLAGVQNSITFQQPMPPQEGDGSLQLVGCADAQREVEVLKDKLLAAFASNATLKPHEVCVIMSDSQKYAPYIESVFSHGEKLPYRMDEGHGDELSAEHAAVLALLDLVSGRFTRKELFTLFTNEIFAKANDIAPEDWEIWLGFCTQTGVLWGYNSEHKQSMVTGVTGAQHWHAGFKKFLLGFCFAPPVDGGFSPLYHAHERTRQQSIGKLLVLVDELYNTFAVLQTKKYTLKHWVELLEQSFNNFLQPKNEQAPRTGLFQSLQQVSNLLNDLEYFSTAEQPTAHLLPFSIIKILITEAVSRAVQSGGGRGYMGGVACVPINAIRIIPFRLVVFLGMNEGQFPSTPSSTGQGYDLSRKLENKRQSNSDRVAFLELFLATQESVWIFFQHINRTTGEALEPSIVVQELALFLGNSSWQVLVTARFPLHPFHFSLFQSEDRSFSTKFLSYAQTFYGLTSISQESADEEQESIILPALSLKRIDITELINFLLDPVGCFLKQTTGSYFTVNDDVVSDHSDEGYDLNSASLRYLLAEVLTDLGHNTLSETTVQRVIQQTMSYGEMTEAAFYRYQLQDLEHRVCTLIKTIEQSELPLGQIKSIPLQFNMNKTQRETDAICLDYVSNNGIRLRGHLEHFYIDAQHSKELYHIGIVEKTKNYAYTKSKLISHLVALLVASESAPVHVHEAIFSLNSTTPTIGIISQHNATYAKQTLDRLIEIYDYSLHTPLGVSYYEGVNTQGYEKNKPLNYSTMMGAEVKEVLKDKKLNNPEQQGYIQFLFESIYRPALKR